MQNLAESTNRPSSIKSKPVDAKQQQQQIQARQQSQRKENNADNDDESKVKFGFIFKVLNENNKEYSFEEIRARTYNRVYEERDRIKSQYEREIEELKRKLAKAEENANAKKHVTIAVDDMEMDSNPPSPINNQNLTNNTVWIDDSVYKPKMSSTRNLKSLRKQSCGSGDYTTINLTNVTKMYRDGDSNKESLEDEELIEPKISIIKELDDEEDIASRTCQQSLLPPSQLWDSPALLDGEHQLKKLKALTNTDTNTIFNESGMMNSIYPTPTSKALTLRTSGARKAMDEILGKKGGKNFYDSTIAESPSRMDSDMESDKPNAEAPETAAAASISMSHQKEQQSIFIRPDTICIHEDSVRHDTTNAANNDKSNLKEKDFSIFIDNSQLNNNNSEKALVGNIKETRKPLQILSVRTDGKSILDDTDEMSELSATAKIEFEPPAASTRCLKPLINQYKELYASNGGSKIFSPNDKSLPVIHDDSLDMNGGTPRAKSVKLDKDDVPFEKLKSPGFGKTLLSDDELLGGDDNNKLLGKDGDDFMTSTRKISKDSRLNAMLAKSPLLRERIVEEDITAEQTQAHLTIPLPNITYEFIEPQNDMTMTERIDQYYAKPSSLAEQIDEIKEEDLKEILKETSLKDDIKEEDAKEECVVMKDELKESQTDTMKLEMITPKDYDASFKHYYQLCYETFNATSANQSQLNPKMNQINDVSVLMGKIVDDELDILERSELHEQSQLEAPSILPNLTMAKPNQQQLQADKDGDETLSNVSAVDFNMSCVTTTTKNLNDTIINSIRNPFNYEIKNRLLNRNSIEYLKKKANYASAMVKMPEVREKGFVFMKENIKVLKEIGTGAYAKIFLAEPQSQDKNGKKKQMALKVDKQSTAWEFYITETIHDRLAKLLQDGQIKIKVADSFIRMHHFVKYNNGCMSTMDYFNNGTLLHLINYHVNRNESFPYWFAIYLTLELLYIVNYLHKCQIIHADIKPDNILLNQLPDSLSYFDPTRTKCLVLIDFNRSIDLSLLPSEAEFDAQCDNKSLLCTEMKSNKPWTYQVDYFGVLSSIHCIIFRKYIKTYVDKATEKNKIMSSFPRSYDSVFPDFFDTFLNIPSCDEMPSLEKDWIPKFVDLFRREMASFGKSEKYLKDLNSTNLTANK